MSERERGERDFVERERFCKHRRTGRPVDFFFVLLFYCSTKKKSTDFVSNDTQEGISKSSVLLFNKKKSTGEQGVGNSVPERKSRLRKEK